jgi:hypothetical protein
MTHPSTSRIAALIVLLISSPVWGQEQPQLYPTRDVDVTYDVMQPRQPAYRQRVRWLAAERLERIEGAQKSTTIFDRKAGTMTMLSGRSRTYTSVERVPRRSSEPPKDAEIKRGLESVVAGLHCVDWDWIEDAETHTICMTADGVLLRLMLDRATVLQARSVSYGVQPLKLFRVPQNYAPALAPEGNVGE